jgi:hypothetical protein
VTGSDRARSLLAFNAVNQLPVVGAEHVDSGDSQPDHLRGRHGNAAFLPGVISGIGWCLTSWN